MKKKKRMYAAAFGLRQELTPQEQEALAAKAAEIIRSHVVLAMSVSVIPSPVIDIFAVTVVEINMIADLARLYQFRVPGDLVLAKVLVSIASGLGLAYLSSKYAYCIKALPFAGPALYAATLSVSDGIAVYAVGKLFQKHFESGGVFLSTSNHSVRKFFNQKRVEGQSVVPALLTCPLAY